MPESTAPNTPPIPTAPIVPLASSYLPEGVQAIKRIEQKSAPNALPPIPPPPPPPVKTGKQLFNFIPWSGRLGMVFKVLAGLLAAVVGFLLLAVILTLTSIDTSIFRLGLSGTVVSEKGQPLANATVKAGDTSAVTDLNGHFSMGGFTIGTYKVHVEADGYESLDQDVALARSFLNYDNVRKFALKQAGIATLKGKIIPTKTGYSFINDRIYIAGKDYRVNEDGSFIIPNLVTGKTKFEFRSVNFRDEVREFQLDSGEKALPDITLTDAGDIIASVKSWIREDIVSNLHVTVEGVDEQFISIADNGDLRVKDLEIGKEYKLRTEYPGYETRDYTITIAQGDNQLFNFKVVEKGFVPFLRKVGIDIEVFASNFDGLNEKALTTGTAQPYGEYIEGNTVYFMSTRDNKFSTTGIATMLVYAASVEAGNAQRITSNTTKMGRIVPNLKAGKLANIREGTALDARVLEMTDLQGNSRNVIQEIPEGTFGDVQISDDGTAVWYTLKNKSKSINGLYHAQTDTTAGKGDFVVNKDNIQLFSVSPSGDRIIYSATNAENGQSDLFSYTFSTKQDSLVKASFTGTQYQFVRGSEDKLLFIETRDGASNMFLLDLTNNNTDKRLSAFTTSTEGVEAIFQQAGYALYRTNKGLYVLDVNQPHPGKLITNKVERYTGYDF